MPPDTSTSEDAKRELETDGWQTLRRFLPYLWPRDNPSLKRRIVIAMMLVLAAKAVILSLPFAYRDAVDAMEGTPSGGALSVALALVL
ncbi:MAG: metal ABC transporter permease, partial [Marinomonas sp.]